MAVKVCNVTPGGYLLETPDTHNCVTPYFVAVDDSQYTVVVNGIIAPCLVAVTVVMNTLVCIVLLKRHMINPTNTILVAIAVSDVLTGLCPTPCYFYFFTLSKYNAYMPHEWCRVYFWLTDYLPSLFHMASVWLTVALAGHRYLCICHSMTNLFSVRRIVRVIVVIYLAAIASQAVRFFEYQVTPVSFPDSTFIGCMVDYASALTLYCDIYLSLYFWFRAVFVHFLPCLLLCFFSTMLALAVQGSRVRRERLAAQNRHRELLVVNQVSATTTMLIVVVGVFLLVEFPVGVFILTMTFENNIGVELVRAETSRLQELISNFVILLSYPINFFIYCAMSRQFRQTFCGLFVRTVHASTVSRVAVLQPINVDEDVPQSEMREVLLMKGRTIQAPHTE